MASLLILKGGNQNQRFELDKDRIVVGRNPDCDLIVSGSPAVSRQHAVIHRVDNEFWIEDLQSRNKTYVNNEEVQGKRRLKENDRVKICDFVATYHETPSLPRLPLPPHLVKGGDTEVEDEAEAEADSTVRSTVDAGGDSKLILEAQPAQIIGLLLEITNSLTRTLELDTLLPIVIDKLFQIYRQADRGFIIIRGEPGRLIPKAIKTRREKDELNARFSRKIVTQCMETGQAILSEDASADARFKMSQSISDFRIRSVMCAPLRGQQDGTVFGVIQLDTQDRNKKFTEEDLRLLVAVSNQAALAMESAKLHEDIITQTRKQKELDIAKEVQKGFLPSQLPDVPGYEFNAHCESALDLGGDLYDFIQLPNNRLAITVGDVAGKGVPAALLMAKFSADARYFLSNEPDLALAITKLNEQVHRGGMRDRFITFVVTVLDFNNHTMTVVNAGHLAPIVLRGNAKIEEVAAGDIAGLPLGILDTYTYQSCGTELAPGDRVVLCTDGITDAMNTQDEAYGPDRLMGALKQAPAPVAQLGPYIIRLVTQFAAGRSQHDDMTLVCFARTPV